jgi:hypothetical protein
MATFNEHLAKLLTGTYGKIAWPAFDTANQMSDQVVRTLFPGTLLFLFSECADRVSNDCGLRLAPLTRQPSDQRLRPRIQPNTQRHKHQPPCDTQVYYRSNEGLNLSVLGPVVEIITLLFKREITKWRTESIGR